MSDEGRLVADRYRIIERVGTGAMGAVWRGQDEILHRTVAIKQLLLQPGLDEHEAEDARQRTMREGRIAARLHHPNAISVFDVVTDEHGQPCLIMEYLSSTSLAAMLQEQNTLPPIEVARIGAQVASALRDAHEVGVVHRDIKPGNVLLAENGTVKLTDFGISRATDDVTVTKSGMIAGTPAYLAPEVAIGGEPGPESDVFALGSTLYAATEGQPPFGLSENTLSLLHAVAAGQINPPRQSGPLASVLAVMLHPDVQHRPTAEESEDLLGAVARGETPLGNAADETVLAPTSGPAAGAGTLMAAGGAGEYLAEPADVYGQDGWDEQSGTLGDDMPAAYTAAYEQDRFDPGEGYPDQDYDSYYPDDDYADPYDAGPYYADAYDDHAGYRDDDGAGGTAIAAPVDDDDDDERDNWKIPAAVAGVAVVGLIALALWIFNPPSGDGEADQPSAPLPTTSTSTSTSSSEPTSTTTTSSSRTTTSTTTPVIQQPENNTGGTGSDSGGQYNGGNNGDYNGGNSGNGDQQGEPQDDPPSQEPTGQPTTSNTEPTGGPTTSQTPSTGSSTPTTTTTTETSPPNGEKQQKAGSQ